MDAYIQLCEIILWNILSLTSFPVLKLQAQLENVFRMNPALRLVWTTVEINLNEPVSSELENYNVSIILLTCNATSSGLWPL